jgi:hypothetical protein
MFEVRAEGLCVCVVCGGGGGESLSGESGVKFHQTPFLQPYGTWVPSHLHMMRGEKERDGGGGGGGGGSFSPHVKSPSPKTRFEV